MMVLSSVIAASSDLQNISDDKHADAVTGYVWMIFNCISSAAFVIFMRYSIRKKLPNTAPFKDFDTVFYNNLLPAPMFIGMSLLGADGNLSEFLEYYSHNPHERVQLIHALIFAGVSAFWISYASSWCMRVTNSTTYSMVGALNKLPIAIGGLIMFPDRDVTAGSIGSIALGFLSGVLYTMSKLKYDAEQRKSLTLPTIRVKEENVLFRSK